MITDKRKFNSSEDVLRTYIKTYGVQPLPQREVAEKLSADVLRDFRSTIRKIVASTAKAKPKSK